MKLGIKVGLRNEKESLENLTRTNPDCVEVWFDINKAGDYKDLFSVLKKRHIDVGLHFWGALPDKTYANISFPDPDLLNSSMTLIKKTIDIAAINNFQYVNIHPGSSAIVKVDFEKNHFTLLSKPVNLDISQNLFLENAKILNGYALSKGIVFTIETVPPKAPSNWSDRERSFPMDIFELPFSSIEEAAKNGLFIANDFEHTAACKISKDPKEIYSFLKQKTQNLLPQTRLIHLGFIIPPYDGTDTHDSMENPLFETEVAIPNSNQMKELLELFKESDVWLIPEPKSHHVENYLKVIELIS